MRSLFVLALLARAAAAEPEGEGKSLGEAYLVSVAATSAPMIAGGLVLGDDPHGARATVGGALMTAGLVFGPSAGHWYCGEGVTPGLVLRVGGFVGVAALAVWDPHGESGMTWLGIGLGTGALATGFAWDALTLPRAVRRSHVVPVVTANGVAIAGRF